MLITKKVSFSYVNFTSLINSKCSVNVSSSKVKISGLSNNFERIASPIFEHKLIATHCCPAFCPKTNSLYLDHMELLLFCWGQRMLEGQDVST